jgi:hypothetical protein
MRGSCSSGTGCGRRRCSGSSPSRPRRGLWFQGVSPVEATAQALSVNNTCVRLFAMNQRGHVCGAAAYHSLGNA